MPMIRRRRPTPIQIFPRRVRRQDPAATTTAASAPEEEEEEEEGPESPDSLFSSPSTVGGEESPSPDTEEFPQGQEAEEPESPAEEGPSGSIAPTATNAASAPGTTTAPAVSSGAPSITALPDSQFSSQKVAPARPTTTGISPGAQSGINGGGANSGNDPPPPPASANNQDKRVMSHGAEAALITFTVLGGIALIIGAVIFFKRRRRRKNEETMLEGEDPFSQNNIGGLHVPEVVHINSGDGHLTRSTNTTNSLFGPAAYERPETVSTDKNRSRISAGQPTPNPFADPPLNKAYDQLRGRPRSTTLTDRGSWIKNPFKDPGSERFDPFGELQEKARMERVKYMQELQREQELLEKERMGLEVPQQAVRKGSDVTIEGLGVLDRSEDGRFPR